MAENKMQKKKEEFLTLLNELHEPYFCAEIDKQGRDCDTCPAYLSKYDKSEMSSCAFDYVRTAVYRGVKDGRE